MHLFKMKETTMYTCKDLCLEEGYYWTRLGYTCITCWPPKLIRIIRYNFLWMPKFVKNPGKIIVSDMLPSKNFNHKFLAIFEPPFVIL